MINRDMSVVQVVTFTEGKDARGMIRKSGYTTRDAYVDMILYNQENNATPMYLDVVMIGLTDDKDISTDNQIIYKDERYDVKYVIPSKRKTQLLLSKTK